MQIMIKINVHVNHACPVNGQISLTSHTALLQTGNNASNSIFKYYWLNGVSYVQSTKITSKKYDLWHYDILFTFFTEEVCVPFLALAASVCALLSSFSSSISMSSGCMQKPNVTVNVPGNKNTINYKDDNTWMREIATSPYIAQVSKWSQLQQKMTSYDLYQHQLPAEQPVDVGSHNSHRMSHRNLTGQRIEYNNYHDCKKY